MGRLAGSIIAVGIMAFAPDSHAGTVVQYVTNGNFSALATPGGAAYEVDTQAGTSTDITGWTSTGYNFIFTPGTATSTGAYSPQYSNYLSLWGAANIGTGVTNTWNGNSPEGGNFIGADGAFEVGAITQSITGLTIGTTYLLTFEWAGAQQHGYNGATSEGWQACLGSTCNGTGMLNNSSNGFTGWHNASFAFKASAATETLSFLAAGTPSGEPPFSLLDNVSLTQDLPEPRTLALMGASLAGLIAARRFAGRRHS
jgi:hypothetical protein